MIEVKQLYKSFGGTKVLNDINCLFQQGRTNLIIGQSGSGKTVLLKSLVGLNTIDSGAVYFDSENIMQFTFKQRQKFRTEIGMVFQGGALFDSMTVAENISFPMKMFSDYTEKEQQKQVDFCLDRVNLTDAANLLPAELSGGMIKRAAIARAIVLRPKYLFCDEPNSGLDPRTAGLIDVLIQEITRESNITTVVNTHDMNSVLTIGDQIVFLFEGNLWWQGDKETILRTDNEELNQFVYSMELTRRLKK